MTGSVVVLCELTDDGVDPVSLQALTLARRVADSDGVGLHAVVLGDPSDEGVGSAVSELGRWGVGTLAHVAQGHIEVYGADAWAAVVDEAADHCGAELIVAPGTDRGAEVAARVAARRDAPFAANSIDVRHGDGWEVTRHRWGGSLLEDAAIRPIEGRGVVVSVAPHAIDIEPAATSTAPEVREVRPALTAADLATAVRRVEPSTEAGNSLATASVVVSGGRGVGSAEGFAPLEELAAALGGAVGCSRAVTNNGWRSHADQVGQTGVRVAPELYIACGISGAVQHLVGAMGSQRILAVNTDPAANMMVRADYAVVGDLHEVVPAVIDELRRRGHA